MITLSQIGEKLDKILVRLGVERSTEDDDFEWPTLDDESLEKIEEIVDKSLEELTKEEIVPLERRIIEIERKLDEVLRRVS